MTPVTGITQHQGFIVGSAPTRSCCQVLRDLVNWIKNAVVNFFTTLKNWVLCRSQTSAGTIQATLVAPPPPAPAPGAAPVNTLTVGAVVQVPVPNAVPGAGIQPADVLVVANLVSQGVTQALAPQTGPAQEAPPISASVSAAAPTAVVPESVGASSAAVSEAEPESVLTSGSVAADNPLVPVSVENPFAPPVDMELLEPVPAPASAPRTSGSGGSSPRSPGHSMVSDFTAGGHSFTDVPPVPAPVDPDAATPKAPGAGVMGVLTAWMAGTPTAAPVEPTEVKGEGSAAAPVRVRKMDSLPKHYEIPPEGPTADLVSSTMRIANKESSFTVYPVLSLIMNSMIILEAKRQITPHYLNGLVEQAIQLPKEADQHRGKDSLPYVEIIKQSFPDVRISKSKTTKPDLEENRKIREAVNLLNTSVTRSPGLGALFMVNGRFYGMACRNNVPYLIDVYGESAEASVRLQKFNTVEGLVKTIAGDSQTISFICLKLSE